MRNSVFAFLLVGAFLLIPASLAMAGPEGALLIDEKGDAIPGYSMVIIDNGLAYPVCNLETNAWYSVILIGTADDGTVLCTVGEPLGTIPEGVATDEGGSNEEEVGDDDSQPRDGR